MGKKIILFFILLSFGLTLQAQQYLTTLTIQANKMANAVVKGDYVTLLKYTHPKVITMMGGKEKANMILKQGMEKLKTSGATLEKTTIGKSQQIIVSKSNIQGLVPQTTDITVMGTKIHSVSYLFCITYNGGKDWYFLDTGNLNEAKLRQMIPEMNAKLVIPKLERTMN
jgi:hypothetical protein